LRPISIRHSYMIGWSATATGVFWWMTICSFDSQLT
jgi:hypothetical protein